MEEIGRMKRWKIGRLEGQKVVFLHPSIPALPPSSEF
jgi:hypothetical protein